MSILAVVIALLVAGLVFEQIATARDRRLFPGSGHLFRVGSHRMYLDCRGEGGPTVVFEAGSGGSSIDWRSVLPGVGSFTRACAYDRAGYGRSDPGSKPRSLERMTSELHQLLQLAGERPPFVFVAHSFGGLIATEYGSRYPKDIGGFVFVDAATKPAYDAIDAAYPQFLNGTGKAVAVARAASVASSFGITRLLRQPTAPRGFDPAVRPEAYALGYQPKVYAAFADETAAFRDNVAHARTDFPRNVPTIVLTHGQAGDMFRGLPMQGADEIWHREQAVLARLFPGAQHEVVRGTGHFIQIDKPEAVVDAIRHVVTEVKARR